MNILVTGVAGFIGFHLSRKLIEKKINVIGIDNLNNYYSVKLKKNRINFLKKHENSKYFSFRKLDLRNTKLLNNFLKQKKIDYIVHLAAQAGIRYSLKNPRSYLENNIICLFNLMEFARNKKIKHFIFGSSSSVYGNLNIAPFKETFDTNSPLQFYGSTKKAGEVFLKTYSYLYNFPVTCLRFFTVYGPWGRPDMAIFSFTKKILENKSLDIFNKGRMIRDFTYIDDIVEGIYKCIFNKKNKFEIYNLGNENPIKLMNMIKLLENNLNKKAKIKFKSQHRTEMKLTHSSNYKAYKELSYKPRVNIENGIKKFIEWYKEYYGK